MILTKAADTCAWLTTTIAEVCAAALTVLTGVVAAVVVTALVVVDVVAPVFVLLLAVLLLEVLLLAVLVLLDVPELAEPSPEPLDAAGAAAVIVRAVLLPAAWTNS
jgi:hypothetical protein